MYPAWSIIRSIRNGGQYEKAGQLELPGLGGDHTLFAWACFGRPGPPGWSPGPQHPSLTTWSRTGAGALLDLRSHNMDSAGKLKCEDMRAADNLPRTGTRAPSFIR